MFKKILAVVVVLLLVVSNYSSALAKEPAPHQEQLAKLDWFVGNWVGEYTAPFDFGVVKEGDRVTYHESTRWILRKNFLVCDSRMEIKGKTIPNTHEIFGWDPKEKTVKHWISSSSLGSGNGVWTEVGETKATLKWSMGTKDETLEGTSILNKVDANTYTWKIKDIKYNGNSVPDLPEFTMRRVKGIAAGELWEDFCAANEGTWLGKGSFSRDLPDLKLSETDKFTFRLAWKRCLDGKLLTGEGTLKVPAKDFSSEVRSMFFWDPGARKIRLVGCWSSGFLEEITISSKAKKGTAFLGTYAAKRPNTIPFHARIRISYPNPDTCVIKLLSGPRKGETLTSFKREK